MNLPVLSMTNFCGTAGNLILNHGPYIEKTELILV